MLGSPYSTFQLSCIWCRLSLDKEDIQAWGNNSKDDVLIHACLSAVWSNNDAIDAAVTNATGGDRQVLPFP